MSSLFRYCVLSNVFLQKLRDSYEERKKQKFEQLNTKVQQLEAEVRSLKDELEKCQRGGGGAEEMEADS